MVRKGALDRPGSQGGTGASLVRDDPSIRRWQWTHRITLFGACSPFTHVTACTLAKSPMATLYIEGFADFVASINAPIATGWSEPVPGRVCLSPWISTFARCAIHQAVTFCSENRVSEPRFSCVQSLKMPQNRRKSAAFAAKNSQGKSSRRCARNTKSFGRPRAAQRI